MSKSHNLPLTRPLTFKPPYKVGVVIFPIPSPPLLCLQLPFHVAFLAWDTGLEFVQAPSQNHFSVGSRSTFILLALQTNKGLF